MKAVLHKNIDLVQIALKAGVERYYFPQNVDWADKVIDRIAICIPAAPGIDPMDGETQVASITGTGIPEIFVYMSDAQQKEIFHEVSMENLINRNNYILDLHKQLDLSLCYISFAQAPAADMTLLMYVYYGDKEVDDYEYPKESITASFPMDADAELTFQEIINQYVHALPGKIKGIVAWNAELAPAYLTMRDHDLTYIIRSVHTEMMRPDVYFGGTDAVNTQVHPLLLDDIDIDFDYSRIRNAVSSPIQVKLTFYF